MYFAMSIGELERSFITGFIEGEATLSICEQNGGQSFSCEMVLKQRDDDQDMLEWLLALTGLGQLRRIPARATSKPQIAWLVQTQEQCVELLALIQACGFHGRRAAELRLWRDAVRVWTEADGDARRSELRRLKGELQVARRYRGGASAASPFAGERQLLGYISGFASAEGSFGMSSGRPRFSIHLRQDDEPLLELLAEATGFGNVTVHRPAPPLNPSATWTVTRRADLAELRDLLWRGGVGGRKLRELEVWSLAVDELNRAAQHGIRPRREVLESARERLTALRVYRPPERPELLRLLGRDVRGEALEALARWSRSVRGKLSCNDYMLWRRDHLDAPDRNTIVRQFGSWQGALEAAGLGDRVARAPRPAGGGERRRRRRREQQGRVVAAVRRFERECGRLPRAVEFFRWRYEAGVDAPTQGTVYKLFPGGWTEVLERARQVAEATV